MDGIKARLNSLQIRLALTLTVLMSIAAVLISAISYYATEQDTHEFQDDHLRDVASMVSAGIINVNTTPNLNPTALRDPDIKVVVQLIDVPGQPVPLKAAGWSGFPGGLETGLYSRLIDHVEWRILVQPWAPGGRLVVAQRAEAKNEIARHASHSTLIRILATIPVLILLMTLMLRWMLAPLSRLTAELISRRAEDIHPIPGGDLPGELQMFVNSINQVLKKIEAAMERQRRFVADAAHELRSPLTALTLQAKNLSMQDMPEPARQKLSDFERGLRRGNDLIDQLLTLARTQLVTIETHSSLDLPVIVRSVFEQLMPLAEAKHVELEYRQSGIRAVLTTCASLPEMTILLRNLVDNAIRYTEPQTRVEVAIQTDEFRAIIEVKDGGPGIPDAERARVFDPFYRVPGTSQPGSGLGLSIVRNIIDNAGGEITLKFVDTARQSGTIVMVNLPQTAADNRVR